MRTSLTSLVFLISFYCSAQNSFPDGVYLSVEQLQNRTPAYNIKLDISYRNDEYQVAGIDSFNKNYFQNEVVAVAKNDSLYLNPGELNSHLHGDFSLAILKGTYIVFTAKMRQVEVNKYSRNGFIINNIVGYRTGPISNYIAIGWLSKSKPYAYILSLKTGNTKLLTTDYFEQRLSEHPDLQEQYENETIKQKADLYYKYFGLLNEKLEKK